MNNFQYIQQTFLLHKDLQSGEIEEVIKVSQNVSSYLQSLPNSFSKTFQMHMKRAGLTIEELEKRSNVSKNTIIRCRTVIPYTPSKETLLRLCIGMDLEFPLAIDLFRKAGYFLGNRKEDVLYILILSSFDHYRLSLCERLLSVYAE